MAGSRAEGGRRRSGVRSMLLALAVTGATAAAYNAGPDLPPPSPAADVATAPAPGAAGGPADGDAQDPFSPEPAPPANETRDERARFPGPEPQQPPEEGASEPWGGTGASA